MTGCVFQKTIQKKGSKQTKTSCYFILDSKPHIRWRRGVKSKKVGDQTIEAMLTVDKKMVKYYGMDAVKYYALTIANIVSISFVFF